MKTILILFLTSVLLCGCGSPGPEQGKRVWIMSDTNNYLFAIKEPNGNLSIMRTCDYAPLWVGLYADILVRWDDSSDRPCYHVDFVRPVEDKQ